VNLQRRTNGGGTLVSQLHASLASGSHRPSRADVLSAFHVASASSFPRYFFKTDPTTSVELAIAKPKASNDMMEIAIFNASETGHIVTIDGVIRQASAKRARLFEAVELEVFVVWSAEKPSVAARLLCCERAVGTVLSKQCYKSRVTGGNFSTLTVLSFPNQPKQQHLISIRVALIEADTQVRFENVALVTLALSMLTS
jgi:hypothetical protein